MIHKRIAYATALLAMFAAGCLLILSKTRKPSISQCSTTYGLDHLYLANDDKSLRRKDVADIFFHKLSDINPEISASKYCSLNVKESNSCVSYINNSVEGGTSLRVCVNTKAKSLVSVVFG